MACRKLAPCLMPRSISGQDTTPRGTLPGEEDLGELEYTDSYTFRLVSRAGPLEDKSQVLDCP